MSITGKKRPRERITTPSTPDQSKAGRQAIHGPEIRITTRMTSATFTRPAATRPSLMTDAQVWLTNLFFTSPCRIRVPWPFQWGSPLFDAGEAFAMMMASFVALVESTGAFIAVSRYASATMPPPSVISRGVGWQGVAILISGLFGTGIGSSVSVENAGLLALTKVGSRRVVQISAGFMIFFSILGKFGAVFASIPAPIVAALFCLFFAYVGAGGLSLLQYCNLNSFRTLFILGFSIFLGLSIPQYFNEHTAIKGYGPIHTGARWFNDMVNVPFSSKAFVGGCVAYFLDTTLHKKDGSIRKDRDVASRAKAQQKQDSKTIRPDQTEQDEKPSQRPASDSGNQNRGRYQNRPIKKAEGMAVSTWPDISHLSVSRPELVNVLRQMSEQVKWLAPDSLRNPGFWCDFHRDHGHKMEDCVALKI
ncbi:hypothetical protein F2Q68_00021056 [Brassica cretica]|uniref:Uncharacterized protein n=1 Tax=Brassica cretica TaxID=69181 RepID=A0A8S9FU68_BRACR|nr:hypothetical protein F2Q68_00021056 [Brassica cretica]